MATFRKGFLKNASLEDSSKVKPAAPPTANAPKAAANPSTSASSSSTTPKTTDAGRVASATSQIHDQADEDQYPNAVTTRIEPRRETGDRRCVYPGPFLGEAHFHATDFSVAARAVIEAHVNVYELTPDSLLAEYANSYEPLSEALRELDAVDQGDDNAFEEAIQRVLAIGASMFADRSDTPKLLRHPRDTPIVTFQDDDRITAYAAYQDHMEHMQENYSDCPDESLPVEELRFKVSEIPGKGLGLVATAYIKEGDMIISERPLIVIPSTYAPVTPLWLAKQSQEYQEYMALRTRHDEKFLREEVIDTLSPHRRKAFMDINVAPNMSASGDELPVVSRIAMNGLSIPLKEDEAGMDDEKMNRGAYVLVGEYSSKINHSCEPNAAHNFDFDSLSMQYIALRDIFPGEEITGCYIYEPCEPTAERQKTLAEMRGLLCQCRRCQDPLSDEKVLDIVSALVDASAHLLSNSVPNDTVLALLLDCYNSLVKESLQRSELHDTVVEYLIAMYQMLGDIKNCLKFGEIYGRFICLRAKFVDIDYTMLVKALLVNELFHQESPLWRARRRTVVRKGKRVYARLSGLSEFVNVTQFKKALNLEALTDRHIARHPLTDCDSSDSGLD